MPERSSDAAADRPTVLVVDDSPVVLHVLQLVFAFVNAPLLATFLLGMFWKRTTGHGAFSGLVTGTLAAALHHGLTLPAGAVAGVKGGWLGAMASYPSEMAQNFWTAIWAFSACFVATVAVSLVTRQRKSESELAGLVYALTPRPKQEGVPWHKRPATLGMVVLALTLVLNIVFWWAPFLKICLPIGLEAKKA